MATCRHKVGLLSLRDCGEMAVSQCTDCNRPVCQKHRKMVTKEGKGEVLCIECYLQQVSEEKAINAGIDREYRRRSFYRSTGYRPYYYGHYRRYRHDDYDYFDRETEAEYGAAEDVMDAEDFQGS